MKLLHIHFYVPTLNKFWAGVSWRSPTHELSVTGLTNPSFCLQQLLLLGNDISGGAIKKKKHTLVFWMEGGHLVLIQSGNSLWRQHHLPQHGGTWTAARSGFSCQLKARSVTQKANYKMNQHISLPHHSASPLCTLWHQGSCSPHLLLIFSWLQPHLFTDMTREHDVKMLSQASNKRGCATNRF